MLLQTNSYVVPKERRSEHARLLRRFKQVLHKLGCDQFEVYEQVGTNWTSDQNSGRFVQIMRFRDRKQQLAVQAAERDDPMAQAVIAEFCELINFPYQQQQGLFAIGYYTSILDSGKVLPSAERAAAALAPEPAVAMVGAVGEQLTMVVDRDDLAETVADSSPGHHAEPIPNPFAEAPIVAPEPAAHEAVEGTNGEGEVDEVSEPRERVLPLAAGEDLDELIRQHFGDTGPGTNGESVVDVEIVEGFSSEPVVEEAQGVREAPAVEEATANEDAGQKAEPQLSEESLPGSGIGAVLDASLEGDDPDLDIAMPAELLDEHEPSESHPTRPGQAHPDEPRHD